MKPEPKWSKTYELWNWKVMVFKWLTWVLKLKTAWN